jgi:hypothetical protein
MCFDVKRLCKLALGPVLMLMSLVSESTEHDDRRYRGGSPDI